MYVYHKGGYIKLDQLAWKGWAVPQRCLHAEEAKNLGAARPIWLNISAVSMWGWRPGRLLGIHGSSVCWRGPTVWSWMLAKVDSSIVSGQTHSPAGSGDRRQPCSFFAPLNIWVSSWKALPTLGEGLFLSEPFLEMPTRLPSGVCLLVDSRPNIFGSQDEPSCHVTSPTPALDLMPSWWHLPCRDGVTVKELVTCAFNVWPPNTSLKKIK